VVTGTGPGSLEDIWSFVTSIFDHEFDGSSMDHPDYIGPFHPRRYTGVKEFRFSRSIKNGTVHFDFTTEMNLIVPLDHTQTPLVIAQN